MNAKPEWHHFDYVSRNIFVHCTLEGLGGKSKQADLILDTGMNRSSVSPALAFELGLPSAGTTNSRAPGGSIVQNMALLHKISLAHYSASELKVTVDSMADYATDLYGRKVDGFLGADFFAGRIVSLDFDQHLLSLDAPAITDGVLLEIEATPFSGLLLVPVTLSNNLTMLAIVDTGSDDNADFGFYEDALYGIEFHITYVSQTNDAAGQLKPLWYGNIGPIKLGSVTFQNPVISRRVKPAENPYGTRFRPGFLTCRFFETYITQIDFKSNRLRLLKSKKHDN